MFFVSIGYLFVWAVEGNFRITKQMFFSLVPLPGVQ